MSNQLSSGEHNPIEVKIDQAKFGYGMDNILSKVQTTSESCIISIVLVLKLVKLMRLMSHCLNVPIRYSKNILMCMNLSMVRV